MENFTPSNIIIGLALSLIIGGVVLFTFSVTVLAIWYVVGWFMTEILKV